ncbi:putative elongator complex protein 4-like [Apostichopus japonicus]|uniref:Elongator complex protein 4 n=1 Tax=Stichopus japonicus TaxID=307972 RepID=A0A2G8LBN4_STIJA|nr:putative elongator complex protein 4-like [Apostichopus japonicus]
MHEHINFVQKEEDTYGHHAHLLLRYFLAEGIMTDHQLFLASANEDPEKILKNLPYPVEGDKLLAEDSKTGADMSSVSEPMKIAWRYECLPKVQDSSTSHKFGHSYDLSRTATSDLLSRVKTGTFYLSEEMKKEKRSHPFLCPTHQRLLERIEREIKDGEFHLTENAQSKQSLNRTVLRIGLQSYGSTLWWDEGYSDKVETSTSLCRFFHALRALLRNSLAVAMVTMPVHLLHDFVEVRRLERLCDAAVQIESFAGSEKETNPIFQDYHGLLHIKHLPRLNSLTVSTPDSMDLGFKLKRKKLTIEKLHLPPEFSESASNRRKMRCYPRRRRRFWMFVHPPEATPRLLKPLLEGINIEGFEYHLPLSFLRAKLKLERERKRNPNGHYGYLLS